MALLFMDSFDHYVTADLTEKWTTKAGTNDPQISAGNGRRGTASLRCSGASSSNQSASITLVPADATAIVGFAFTAATLTDRPIMATLDAASPQFSLRMNADGTISAYRGNLATLLDTSAAPHLADGVTAYIEVKVLHSQTVGTVLVHVDGVEAISLTGQDTCATANESWNGVRIGGNSTGPSAVTWDFDDVYICDGSGASNNDLLGDVRVDAHLPGGAGTTTGWTASAGNNYACVDESAPNDDTDYVSTDTVNAIDTYAFPSLANAGGAIQGIQVLAACMKEDAGACSIAPVVRPVATDRVGTTVAVGTTYAYHLRQCYDTSPETGTAWTESEFNGCEFGVKKIV